MQFNTYFDWYEEQRQDREERPVDFKKGNRSTPKWNKINGN